MVDTIILRFQKKIFSINKKFVWNVVFKFIYLKKANFVYYRSTKKNINISYKNAIAKFKQFKSKVEFAEKIKLVAKSILISTLEFNISANLSDAVNSNKIATIAISLFLDLTIDICLTICKYKNQLYLVMLNILYIFIDVYDKSQANNIFHQALY